MNARTIHYSPEGDVTLREIDVPAPGPGEVQLKGLCCGICSWDIATCKRGREMPLPAPPGHEGVGVVTRVGEGVSGIEVGEKYAEGGFQTLYNKTVAELSGKRLPESSLPGKYWLVEPVSCCVTAMDTSPLRAGDRVAVVGCGFMGLIILQLLSQSFAVEIIALDINPDRLELAGAIPRVNPMRIESAGREAMVRELKSKSIDIVYDTSGSQEGLSLSTDILRQAGHLNLFGWVKGTQATFNPSAWHLGGINIHNSSPAGRVRDPFPPAIRLMEEGIVDLRPFVSHVVTLEEYPSLMESILKGNPDYLKGVVMLSEQ